MVNETTLLQVGDCVQHHFLKGHYYHRVQRVSDEVATLTNGWLVRRPVAANRDVAALDDEGVVVVLGTGGFRCLWHCRFAPEELFTGLGTKEEFLATM